MWDFPTTFVRVVIGVAVVINARVISARGRAYLKYVKHTFRI
jgi:hypothetical protein